MNSLAKAFGIGALVLSSLIPLRAQSQNTDTIEILPINYYQTARAYEDSFSAKKDTNHAKRAIDYFERYYVSAPDGALACNALIRKALLLHKIGRDSSSQLELNRMKERPKCKNNYSNVIKYVESLTKRSQNPNQ